MTGRKRAVWGTAIQEYISLIMSQKCILLLVMIVPVREVILLPMARAAQQMQTPLNLWEAPIAMANSGLILLILPIIYLVLMADHPRLDSGMQYRLVRMGRKNWMLGELLFLAMSSLSYLVFILLTGILPMMKNVFWGNGWSLVVTDYDSVMGECGTICMNNILQSNLWRQMTPYKALLLSLLLLEASFLIWGLLLLLASQYAQKLTALWGIVIYLLIGLCLSELQMKEMWVSLFAHSVLWVHFQSIYRDYVFSPYASLGIMLAIILILTALNYRKAAKVNPDLMMEEDQSDKD